MVNPALTILKMYKCIIGKNKNIMYYNTLLERREKTEAIDILHFKIARGMKGVNNS